MLAQASSKWHNTTMLRHIFPLQLNIFGKTRSKVDSTFCAVNNELLYQIENLDHSFPMWLQEG